MKRERRDSQVVDRNVAPSLQKGGDEIVTAHGHKDNVHSEVFAFELLIQIVLEQPKCIEREPPLRAPVNKVVGLGIGHKNSDHPSVDHAIKVARPIDRSSIREAIPGTIFGFTLFGRRLTPGL
jgi:hypothetical protein